MKLTLEMNDCKYSVETPYDDTLGNKLKETFARLLVVAGYPPSVIEFDDGGSYLYVGKDEEIVKKEEK